MPINTVFQLMSERGSAAAAASEAIALVPDLINLWLTGELANEATNASTTGLLEATGRSWAIDLIARLGIPERPFTGEVLLPGRQLGSVLQEARGSARDPGARGRLPRHRVGVRRDAARRTARGGAVVGHVVAARTRGPGADPRRRGGRVQPDQRTWLRRHRAAAPKRHGTVAASRNAGARGGTPGAISTTTSSTERRAKRRRTSHCSTRISRRCCAAATCRR